MAIQGDTPRLRRAGLRDPWQRGIPSPPKADRSALPLMGTGEVPRAEITKRQRARSLPQWHGQPSVVASVLLLELLLVGLPLGGLLIVLERYVPFGGHRLVVPVLPLF